MSIAVRENTPLDQAEAHLAYAWLYLAMENKAKAWESLATAKEMMAQLDDARLEEAVQELEAQLAERA
jgi:hypothetical protein